MIKHIKQYLQSRDLKKAEKRIERQKRIDADNDRIRRGMADGSLWKHSHYPEGHPAHISSIDR